MARIVEPLIQETLWSELESRGFRVHGEVTLPESGRIDLYVVTPNGSRWGIEVKNHWNMISWGQRDEDLDTDMPHPEDEIKPSELQSLTEQLDRYAESGYCDSMYVATQDPEPLIRAIEDRDDLSQKTNPFIDKWGSEQPPEYIGAIQAPPFVEDSVRGGRGEIVPPQSFDNTGKVEIIRQPTPLTGNDTRSNQPSESPPIIKKSERRDSKYREADIAHGAWKCLNQQTSGPILREPVIPNKRSQNPQQPDIMYFVGSTYPTTIYRKRNDGSLYGHGGYEREAGGNDGETSEKPEHKAVAIEVKPEISGQEKIADQLKRYLNSGGLNELFLCLPKSKIENGIEFIESHDTELVDIGLMGYDFHREHLMIAKEATTVELEYPTIELSSNNHSVCQIGWGMGALNRNNEFVPVWDQENLQGRYDDSDPTQRTVSELKWSDKASQTEGYEDPETQLIFVECSSCGLVVEHGTQRCPDCNKQVFKNIMSKKARPVGTDEHGNRVYTKLTG